MKFSKRQLSILGLAAAALLGSVLLLQSSVVKKTIVGALSGGSESAEEKKDEKKEDPTAAADKPATPAFDPTKPSGLDDAAAKQGSFSDEDDDDYEPNPEMQAIMDAREAKLVALAKKHKGNGAVDTMTAPVTQSKIIEPMTGVTVRVVDYGSPK